MADDRRQSGIAGEKAARDYLVSMGYRILGRNFSCPMGEIDLICYHEGTIVFVEVKSRADDAADPEESITYGKRRRMTLAARTWLAKHRDPECAYRFDAVSVAAGAGKPPNVRHIIEAFLPGA